MAIIYYKFVKPINVSELSKPDLDSALLFAKKKEIPAGHKIDITPEGYEDKYTLTTRINKEGNREDTVGEVVINELEGKALPLGEGGIESEGGSVERGGETLKFPIDKELGTFFVCRPSEVEGVDGYRLDGIIQYERT
jgi:hypothetical protein